MEKINSSAALFTLGVDLGTNSLGWALTGLEEGKPTHLIRCGVRVFDAGMEGDIESGQEESRNLKRRQMRSQRRTAHRSRRGPPTVAAANKSAPHGAGPFGV
ncbi:MAG: hypothetical protein ACRD3T_12495 [Terriglobia bacterium]